jgi:serine/threonine protein kinase
MTTSAEAFSKEKLQHIVNSIENGRFQYNKCVEKGGFSKVYEAYDTQTSKNVAIKLVLS